MRKLTLVVLVAVLAFGTVNAQEKYGTFKSGTISSSVAIESGKVYLDLNKEGDYGLVLTKKDRAKFVLFLLNSRVKFLDWSGTAKDNGVKDMNKDIAKISLRGVFHYGSWKFGTASIETLFYVQKDGSTRMYVYGNVIESSSNKYIKSDSEMIDLTSDKDFNSLVKVLNNDTIDSFINAKNKSNDLFN
jgi:hypothetical protein